MANSKMRFYETETMYASPFCRYDVYFWHWAKHKAVLVGNFWVNRREAN